ILAGTNNANTQPAVIPDTANFTLVINAPTNTVVFTNTSTIGNLPGPRKAYWHFGDGAVQQTPPLQGTQHQYTAPGTYTVCLKIYRYFPNNNDSVLTSQICKTLVIQPSAVCQANFTTVNVASTPLGKYFVAQPSHSQNKKPVRICWNFGDGQDTCIQYPTSYTGNYGVYHQYTQPGLYNVCVNILYEGGCQANKCNNVQVGNPDSCRADFERLPVSATANPLTVIYKALPWHNNNKKPTRICWDFGDGRDTCINYTNSYTGPYNVAHTYQHPGLYNVCVKITYAGGCYAAKCKPIQVGPPDTCKADFERLPLISVNNPLQVAFKALPQHNNNRKPARICWQFGDGSDTCINYPENYNGQYIVTHRYDHPGIYEVCVNIKYYGGCEARKCKPVVITRPDTCKADFERLPVTTNNPLQVYYKALPQHNNNKKPSQICWKFGDGTDTCINYTNSYTGPYAVGHRYNHPGLYEVCVKITYFGGCEARKCKPIQVGRPDTCKADFERLPITTNNPLQVYYKALPQHNNNRKPSQICWKFGDGTDTCINYTNSYTGPYAVGHRYEHPGLYEVCVKITYFGGCEARKCKPIQVGRPDSCRADFEKLPITAANNPLVTVFKALPQHNNNRKPARICWEFGDGRDTCINYPENYNGQYIVTHRYNHPGVYEVCVNIKYYGGCEARKCKPVVIVRPDSCSADFERMPTVASTPLTVGFKAIPGHNNNRKPARICWQFGDGRDTCINYPENYTGLYNVTHQYNQPGQYEVCVKILYYGGCDARKCKPVVIPPPPVNCTVKLFEITPSVTSLVRGFMAVPLSPTPNNRPVRICWFFGDGEDTCIMLNNTVPQPYYIIRHTYPGPGVYRACVKVRFENGCVAEDCKEVVIRSANSICGGFMIDSLMAPRTFKFKGHSINAPNDEVIHYRWTFGDGTSALGREVTHTYAAAGNYEVCLYIKTRLGCETRICRTVRVPGNNQPALVLTPNPVITVLNAAFFSTHTEPVNIRILNSTGTVVRSYVRNANVGPNTWSFDLTTLLPGVYTMIVQSPNQLSSAIFMKQ
ncbi:MAG: PKD domain-containing protein, partial [Chitinophagaceae bacterium]|nr:PKD domain-containing protein [Chitinophagaceae bacterium]